LEQLRFDGRVAIVTGAGGNPGLGRSYALLLASRGAKVLVNDYGVGPDGRGAIAGGPHEVVSEIKANGGEALANHDSVATPDGAARIVQAAADAWGRVDIVINNAGIAPFALFDEISDTDIERIVDVHLMGTIWMCRAAWKHMVVQRYGRLVNIMSSVGLTGATHQSIYSGAKLGIFGLTRAVSSEGMAHGIGANLLMPMANTLAWETMLESSFSEQARRMNLMPELVAPVAVWLAHESCRFTGKTLGASGGSIYEIFIAKTKGTPPDPNLTIDTVEAKLTDAMDRSDYQEYAKAENNEPTNFVAKPYSPEPRARGNV
jgi:NAD(P)-dependent dehydrogenase (short-subunit alcohol dehydrogenase family)